MRIKWKEASAVSHTGSGTKAMLSHCELVGPLEGPPSLPLFSKHVLNFCTVLSSVTEEEGLIPAFKPFSLSRVDS